jgi:hypothetical protein
MKHRHLIVGVCAILLAASFSVRGGGYGLDHTAPHCWSQWVAMAADCCGKPHEKECLDASLSILAACLEGVPRPDPPNFFACWSEYLEFIHKKCKNPSQYTPCGNENGERACRDAALLLLRWCLGRPAPIDANLGITPIWQQYPATIQPGQNYQFVVKTDDTDVEEVRFWVIRLDASGDDADPDFPIGWGDPQPIAGDTVHWSLTSDTGTWPLAETDERIVVVARSERWNEDGTLRILDASAVEIEIDQ